ncbi:hypothetical protein C8J57DRAFT_1226569 [Mycena rebaudengoi]|nr:hypothetical protein C8J57DRAFT_1226569 [Mycena rebaudengoi]
MGTCTQIIVVLVLLVRRGDSERGRIASAVGWRRGFGGSLGESGISTYWRGEVAGEGRKGGAVREDSKARMNDETMSLVWAMPALAAAHLAHIEALGLGAFADMRPKNMLILKKKKATRTVDRDLTVMLPIHYPFFNPFNLIPILVADVVCAPFLIFEYAIAHYGAPYSQADVELQAFKVPDGFIWMPAGGRLEFRLQRKAGYQLEKMWDQFL